ncbi:lipopolysaccharide biosynthesis protein [Aquabacterium olei]|uniref:lipopolysaccharide biosynthesis protein n=1 Tax=Aquabacterium olei TaxID=1296669 RepID=UPI00131F0890|nr:lipopolysaccharide biosynthesis protein [Aquabacterium olei]
MSVRTRIISALAANTFGQAVTIGTQIFLIPLYFRSWGAELYGQWLVLTALPAYLTMADLGIGSAAGNEMTMRAGAEDRTGAQQTYRGAFWIAGLALCCATLLGLVFVLIKIITNSPVTSLISDNVAAIILMLLAVNVGMSFFGGVYSAGYRCAGRNGTGIFISNCSRLTEATSTAALLISGFGPIQVCVGILTVKAAFLAIQAWHLPRVCPWLYSPHVKADKTLARRLIKPSLGFMAFPASGALSLQGPILILGTALGGEAVAIFSAMRTLARIPMQATNVLNASVWPEMSRAFGAHNLAQVRRLHRGSAAITAMAASCSGFTLAVFGGYISSIWLGSSANFQPFVLHWLLAASAVSSLWNTSSIVLASSNSHSGMGVAMVVSSALSILLGWELTESHGLVGMLISLLIGEVTIFLYVVPRALKLTEDSVSNITRIY